MNGLLISQILGDPDLVAFVATVGSVLINGPRLLRRLDPMPADYNIEEVAPQSLTEKQKAFFDAYDQKLAAMNYFPLCTYRVTNYQRTLMRRYAHPSDPASCTVLAMEVKYHANNQVRWAPTSLVTFRTDFTDGTTLTTRNMRRKTLLDTLPGFTVQECPNLEDPADLKKRHDEKAAGMGCPEPPLKDTAKIFAQIRDEHRRFSEYQVQRGLLAPDIRGYVLTNKAHWRGIRNHYNPFVQRVPPLRMVASALLAIGLPSLTHAYFTSAFASASPSAVMAIAAQAQVAFLVSYAIAGVTIGLLIERNAFLWGFLLTYLGVHLCTGWWSSPIPYSLIAASIAYWVTRMQHRRKLMLAASNG